MTMVTVHSSCSKGCWKTVLCQTSQRSSLLCARAPTQGRLDQGRRKFQSMQQRGVELEPHREHYGCLADLLGRAGRVEEAETVLLDMPMVR